LRHLYEVKAIILPRQAQDKQTYLGKVKRRGRRCVFESKGLQDGVQAAVEQKCHPAGAENALLLFCDAILDLLRIA
jgi:hypothetical protein